MISPFSYKTSLATPLSVPPGEFIRYAFAICGRTLEKNLGKRS